MDGPDYARHGRRPSVQSAHSHATTGRRPSIQRSEESSEAEEFVFTLKEHPSRKLRALVTEMETTEGLLEELRKENAKLKLKCLQNMMGAQQLGKVAALGMGGPVMLKTAFQRWQGVREDLRQAKMLGELKLKLIQKKQFAFARMFGAQAKNTMKVCFLSWYNVMEMLKDEKQIMEELAAHRNGRGQLIEKYHELEAEFVSERTRGQELENSLQETVQAIEQLQSDFSISSNRVAELNAELDQQRSKTRSYQGEVDELREKQTSLRRDQTANQQKTSSLQALLEEEEREKRDLSERLIAVEQSLEGLRSETARGETKLQRYEALAAEKEDRIHALSAQLDDAQNCIANLRYGADMYLGERREDYSGARDFDQMREKIDGLLDKVEWSENVARINAAEPLAIDRERGPSSPNVLQQRAEPHSPTTVLRPTAAPVPRGLQERAIAAEGTTYVTAQHGLTLPGQRGAPASPGVQATRMPMVQPPPWASSPGMPRAQSPLVR